TTIDYENNDVSGTVTLPGANNATPLSQRGREQGGYRFTGEWAWQASKHVHTKVVAGYNLNELRVGPQGIRGSMPDGVNYNWYRAPHWNADDNTFWFNDSSGPGGPGTNSKSTRRRYQLDASVTVTGEAAGKHEAEFGVQTSFMEHREVNTTT